MSAAALLDRLDALGVTVTAAGGALTVDAPAGVLSPALLADMRRHKPAILALLTGDGAGGDLNTAEKPGANSSNQTIGGDPAAAWRAAAMGERHPRPWAVVPTLTARDMPRGSGSCLSCGEPVADHPGGLAARCGACVRAAHLLLSEGVDDAD